MAQEPEQPRMHPELNGHSEHIIPELPQRHMPDETEQAQQVDPSYSYGATPAPQPQEISEPPKPAAPPSYDSPEFYTQPQQPAPQQMTYREQPYEYGTLPPSASYPPYGATSGYGYGAPQSPQYGRYSGQYGQHNQFGMNGNRGFDFDRELPSSPLPLGEAIRGLFSQYGQVITHPSPKLFAREMGKAKWNIVWVQIIAYSIIVALFSLLSSIGVDVNAVATSVVTGADTSGLSPAAVGALHYILVFVYAASIYGQVLITPITIFIAIGVLFLLAKAFGGTGKFLSQLYCSLLFLVPLGIISSFLSLLLSYLPVGGSTLAFLIAIAKLVYECMLLGYLLIPVHRISRGRATGAVLLLCGVVVLLACIFAFVFSAIFAAAIGLA